MTRVLMRRREQPVKGEEEGKEGERERESELGELELEGPGRERPPRTKCTVLSATTVCAEASY